MKDFATTIEERERAKKAGRKARRAGKDWRGNCPHGVDKPVARELRGAWLQGWIAEDRGE